MENQDQNQVNNKKSNVLKYIIIVLVLLLGGSGYYIYKLGVETKIAQQNEIKVVEQKAGLLANLEKQKADYEIAINDKSAISADLEIERAKVIQLIAQVKKAKGDLSSLSSYKQKYLVLESKMKELMIQNEELKKKNIILTTERDSTVNVLGETKKYNEELASQNADLTNTVLKASKLSVVGLKAVSLKLKSSGKQVDTDKASSTDLIKIFFSVVKNPVAKSGDRYYYVQVIDANNNVLGKKQTQTFGDKVLTYSIKSKVIYKGETVNILEELLYNDFTKGTYFINLFDQGVLIADTTFTLR